MVLAAALEAVGATAEVSVREGLQAKVAAVVTEAVVAAEARMDAAA